MDSFKYLGSISTKDGSSTKEVKTKLHLVASAMTRLNVIWKSNSISFPVKLKLLKSLVVFCSTVAKVGPSKPRRIQAFEHTCYRRLVRISYTEHRMYNFVRQVTNYAGRQKHFSPRSSDGSWLGMVTSPIRTPWPRSFIPQGTVEGT